MQLNTFAVCLLAGLVMTGCGPAATPVRVEPPGLVASLDRILAWQQKNAPAIAATLQPGLSRTEIDAFANERRVVLPQEIYQLYGWRNGMREPQPFFDEYQFLPLDQAFKGADVAHAASRGGPYRLPILQSILSDAYYEVVCLQGPNSQAPVEFAIDGVPSPDMESVTTFARALAAAFDKGVFTMNADGLMDANRPALERVLLEFRPRLQADVELVLRGQGASLPLKRETQATYSLVLTENPRAEELVSQSLDRWANDREARFIGFRQLAHLNTATSRAHLQKYATHLDRDVRRAVFSVLAWRSGKDGKIDPVVVDSALQDLRLPEKSKMCDQREIARVLRWSPDRRPVPALIGLLSFAEGDCARDTRIAAAQSLALLGDPSAVAPLLARLKVETDPGTQYALAGALADLGNAEGERQLRARLEKLEPGQVPNAGESRSARRIAQELLAQKKP